MRERRSLLLPEVVESKQSEEKGYIFPNSILASVPEAEVFCCSVSSMPFLLTAQLESRVARLEQLLPGDKFNFLWTLKPVAQ